MFSTPSLPAHARRDERDEVTAPAKFEPPKFEPVS